METKEEEMKIGLGMAALGRPQYINIRMQNHALEDLEAFRERGMQVLQTAYDRGIRYFDTAPGYGMAESMLINWLQQQEDDSISVATKWGYTYVANFDPEATIHEIKEHSLHKLEEQWEQSKKLLPHLSVYQIHSATFDTGVLNNDAVLHQLNALKAAHKLHIGLTTTGYNQVEVLKQAMDIAVDGSQLFDVFQVTYNVLDQSLASMASDLDWTSCKLVIKEAIANGRVFPQGNFPQYNAVYQVLNHLAVKYQVGIDAIALRFCLDSLPVHKVLSGALTTQHLIENLKATTFKLEEADIDELKTLGIPPKAYWHERKQLAWN